MIKLPLKIGLLVIPFLLVFSFAQIVSQPQQTTDSTSATVHLSNTEINQRWPNLPTAQEIYDDGECLIADLRYSGKKVSTMNPTLPDPESPTVIDIESQIVNCTQNSISGLQGGIEYDVPRIWLQYNDTVWVLVPEPLFK